MDEEEFKAAFHEAATHPAIKAIAIKTWFVVHLLVATDSSDEVVAGLEPRLHALRLDGPPFDYDITEVEE